MSRGRFWLGMAEMASATVALILLAATGVSVATIIAALVATGLMAVSRALYHGRPKFPSPR